MKKCTYCGRENQDEAAHCAECGTEEFVPVGASPPEAPNEAIKGQEPVGPVQSVASLEIDEARDLLKRLRKEGIAADLRLTTHESGLEIGDVVVEDSMYERACEVAEDWEADLAEANRNPRRCPKC